MTVAPYGRSMQFPTAIDALLGIGEAIVADGLAAHEHALAELVAAARSLGVPPVLVDVVADPAGPSVPRERALGRVLVELAAVADRSTPLAATATAA